MAWLNYGYLLNDPNWLELIAALPIGNENGPDPTSVFDEAIRKEKIPPMLIVFPNGRADSMWCDSKDGSVPMEQVVIQELLPLVDRDFRTIAMRYRHPMDTGINVDPSCMRMSDPKRSLTLT